MTPSLTAVQSPATVPIPLADPAMRPPVRAEFERRFGAIQSAPRRAWIVPVALAFVATVVRLVSFRGSYDIYVDEYFYVDMGTSVSHGNFPPRAGSAFFLLHPPGFFSLEALWTTLVRAGGSYEDRIFAVRELNVVLAVVTTVCLYLLLRRLASRTAAVAGAAYFAIEPFVLRQNARGLLETATFTFVIAGWLLVVRSIQDPARRTADDESGDARRPAIRAVLIAGLVLGCAPLVKDMAAAVTTLPLIGMAVTGWGLRRRESLTAAAASLVPYIAFVLATVAQGGGAALVSAKLGGLSRLAGLTVTTGFNASTAKVGAVQAAVAQALNFGTTYAAMGLGSLAALALIVRSRRDDRRVIGLVTICAAGLIGYSMAFGTAEEHLLYFLLLPALVSLVVVLDVAAHRRIPRWVRIPVTAVLLAALCWNAGMWVQTRTTPDDGQQRFTAWMQQHVPPGDKIAWIVGQTSYEVSGAGRTAVPLSSPGAMAKAKVRYLVVLHKEVDQGYTFTTPATVAWFAQRSQEVFSFDGPTYGRISVYQSTNLAVW
jgi:hypothetical protein